MSDTLLFWLLQMTFSIVMHHCRDFLSLTLTVKRIPESLMNWFASNIPTPPFPFLISTFVFLCVILLYLACWDVNKLICTWIIYMCCSWEGGGNGFCNVFGHRVLDDGRCVMECARGKYQSAGQCHLCDHTCGTCVDSGANSCTSCETGEECTWLQWNVTKYKYILVVLFLWFIH